MSDVTTRNFGLLIAYVVPGFVMLVILSQYSELLRSWVGDSTLLAPTVGGFVYVTVASVAVGILLGIVRAILIDSIHHLSGVPKPHWDFTNLQYRYTAFQGAIENHYRYYQHFAGMSLVMLMAAGTRQPMLDLFGAGSVMSRMLVILAAGLYLAASRDALKKYYSRSGMILGTRFTLEEKEDERMAKKGRKEKAS